MPGGVSRENDLTAAVEAIRRQRSFGSPSLIDVAGAKRSLKADYGQTLSLAVWRRAVKQVRTDDKWMDKQMKRHSNPSRRSVALKNFSGTITRNANGTVTVKGKGKVAKKRAK
jgi:hypothetical protein